MDVVSCSSTLKLKTIKVIDHTRMKKPSKANKPAALHSAREHVGRIGKVRKGLFVSRGLLSGLTLSND